MDEKDEQGGDPTEDKVERMTADTPVDKLTDFQKGARALFDALQYRAANHWHPHAMEQCNYDNKIIYEWSEDALEEVDPKSASEWKSINRTFTDGVTLGKAMKVTETSNQQIDDHIASMKQVGGILGVILGLLCIAILAESWIPKNAFVWVLAAIFVPILFIVAMVMGRAYRLQGDKRGGTGFKPPAPMPPATPPADWTPKM